MELIKVSHKESNGASSARALLLETFGEAHKALVERVLFQISAQEAVDKLLSAHAPAPPLELATRSNPFDDPFSTFNTTFGEEPPLL